MIIHNIDKARFIRKLILYCSFILLIYSLFFLSSIRRLPLIHSKVFIAECAADEGIVMVSVEDRYHNQYRYKFHFVSGKNEGLSYECATASGPYLSLSRDPSPAVISESEPSFYIDVINADTFFFRRTFSLKNMFCKVPTSFFDLLAPDCMTSAIFYSLDSAKGAEILSRIV